MYNILLNVEPDTGVDSVTYGRVFHQCEGIDFVPIPNSGLRATWQREEQRCGGDSSWLVTHRGHVSGRVYTRHLCERHAKPYLEEWERMNAKEGNQQEGNP